MKYLLFILTVLFSFQGYSQNNISLFGMVLDADIDHPIENSNISLLGSNGTIWNTKSNMLGVFSFDSIPPGFDYILVAERKSYLNGKVRFSTIDISKDTSISILIELHRAHAADPFPIIYFEMNDYSLDSVSFENLIFIKNMMLDNPYINLEIGAHRSYNEEKSISIKRGANINDTLVSLGISSKRLSVKDYGAEKPLKVSWYLKNEYPDLDIDSCFSQSYIQTLPSELQKLANKMNRIVEFAITNK